MQALRKVEGDTLGPSDQVPSPTASRFSTQSNQLPQGSLGTGTTNNFFRWAHEHIFTTTTKRCFKIMEAFRRQCGAYSKTLNRLICGLQRMWRVTIQRDGSFSMRMWSIPRNVESFDMQALTNVEREAPKEWKPFVDDVERNKKR